MCDKADIANAIKAQASELGFDACGFARAEAIDDEARQQYQRWLEDGRNGCMEWAERYCDVRDNPQLLLEGAQTVIMLAMNYYPQHFQPPEAPQVAYYAYGSDYHDVLRERLKQLTSFIHENTGAQCRCCVDTAPLRERYWAQKAGLGFVGLNNQLILPGKGSYFFLGSVITTLELPPDDPCRHSCGECRACIEACPGHALTDGEAVDARQCLSCLTIEQRGELPQWAAQAMGNRVYGCDECQRCCPHNRNAKPTKITSFQPSDQFISLTTEDLCEMTPMQFSSIFGKSAVRRAKLEGLQRNARIISSKSKT